MLGVACRVSIWISVCETLLRFLKWSGLCLVTLGLPMVSLPSEGNIGCTS